MRTLRTTRPARRALTALLACALLAAGCSTDEEAGVPERVLWSDEFDGAAGAVADPAAWTYETGAGGWGNDEVQSYTDRTVNAATDGRGNLAVTAIKEDFTGADGRAAPWTSARITTLGKRAVHFGRIEVRAHVPSGQGIWPAAWTLGTSIREIGWPDCGEIDVIETINDADEALQTVHGPSDNGPWLRTQRSGKGTPLDDGFHTYSADWKPGSITFAVDGRTTGTFTADQLEDGQTWPLDQPQYVLLNVAVGGRLPGPTDASTPDRATMLVDYVRVYANGSEL